MFSFSVECVVKGCVWFFCLILLSRVCGERLCMIILLYFVVCGERFWKNDQDSKFGAPLWRLFLLCFAYISQYVPEFARIFLWVWFLLHNILSPEFIRIFLWVLFHLHNIFPSHCLHQHSKGKPISDREYGLSDNRTEESLFHNLGERIDHNLLQETIFRFEKFTVYGKKPSLTGKGMA